MEETDTKKGEKIIVSVPVRKRNKEKLPSAGDTGSFHILAKFHTIRKIVKTIIHRKVTWDNQFGNFTSKEKVQGTGLHLPLLTQSREVTAFSSL